MRAVTEIVRGVGNSPTIPMDFRAQAFNVGIQVVVTGTVTYTVQITLDDIYDPTVVPTWSNMPMPFTGATATLVGNMTIPVKAMRLSVTAGTGNATITLLQTSGQG